MVQKLDEKGVMTRRGIVTVLCFLLEDRSITICAYKWGWMGCGVFIGMLWYVSINFMNFVQVES